MNIPKFALDNSKLVYFFLIMMLIGGIFSFGKLGKKEDAPFVIKSVVLITQYPGATPAEVEKLITEPIEREVQSLAGVDKIRSESTFGMSKITVELDPATPPGVIPQKWDEMRRKVLNIQPRLPQGCSSIIVNDDFGDVFGIYYALVADQGYSWDEMRRYAQMIKTELVTVPGVQKVSLFGEQTEVVNIFITTSTLANLGIDPNQIVQIISSQNQLVNTGTLQTGEVNLTVVASGTYANLQDIRDQVITNSEGVQLSIGDFAVVEKGYLDPPNNIMKVNGKRAIGVGVASLESVDVVKTGELVDAKIKSFMPLIPVGMELEPLYLENVIAAEANNGFIINLIESIAIVILIIMLVMGLRSGVLIGSSLLFSIGGTMLLMLFMGVGLNRTSLAGFIIAMGMLVDNAIVVTDNAQVMIKRGVPKRKALIDAAIQPQWGLLGATFIAIVSFLPLYLAPSAVAEIVKPLFIVLALSLGLSWILALTQTPLFGSFMLKDPKAGIVDKDPYDKPIYNRFARFLAKLIRFRWLTIGSVLALFAVAMWVMSIAPSSFFPNLDKPYFRADCVLPDGYSIHQMDKEMSELSDWLQEQPGVKNVSITVGSTPLRYYLASTSIGPKPNCGNFLVELETSDSTASICDRFSAYAKENYPNMLVRASLFKLSPAVEAAIEIGFIGENPDTLVMLAEKAKALMRECDMVTDVRSDWGNKVAVVNPVYSQEKGQRLGVTRQTVASYTKLATNGLTMGDFRQGDQFMPILLKDANIDEFNLANFGSLPVFTPRGGVVALDQVIDSISNSFQYGMLKRYQRQLTLRAQCDPLMGANTAAAYSQVYNHVFDRMEAELPNGYQIKVFGEQESQTESNQALAANMPLTFFLIFATLLLLFRVYRKPLIILLMIPLIFVGVVFGLAVSGKMLDFFAILGLLGLVGMNIKNAVVLVDQIDIEIAGGLAPLQAVIQATKSRIVPVVMASGTTILGMLPLLPDALFGGMAAVIMGGLFVATFLTIFVLPVTYCTIMRIKN
ncbi:AcrB/D/F family transporter [Mucinivorans hirudinis]|uniref:AcrB/D/F family transporter n=1 Tax=Mucinivorans hirudinis TaxID=1433126 RepID=A0A060R5X2_9BACT|nr:AcrB/D/F family transporter [Mucinivorans hirudinis]